jgi:hypothetical protein
LPAPAGFVRGFACGMCVGGIEAGFVEYGYRAAIVVAFAAEAGTAVFLGGYLVSRRR